MKEWKKIWYKDRVFLIVLAVALVIAFLSCHAAMKKHVDEEIRLMEEILQYWKESGSVRLDVSDDLRHVEIMMEDNRAGRRTVGELAGYALGEADDYEMQNYYVMAAFLFSAAFLGKWILENGGRRKEFISLLPVRSRNVWVAEFLEGFAASALFACLYIGDGCIQQMRITRACKAASAELSLLKETVGLDAVFLSGAELFLTVQLVYAIFWFTKELVNVPAVLIVLIPVNYFAPAILGAYWELMCLMAAGECTAEIELFFLKGVWRIILVVALLAISYVLHTKKDVSHTKVFRFKAAEAVYLLMTFCFFYICIGGLYELKGGDILKSIFVFALSGIITFAVWVLAERKATTLFLSAQKKI